MLQPVFVIIFVQNKNFITSHPLANSGNPVTDVMGRHSILADDSFSSKFQLKMLKWTTKMTFRTLIWV